MGEPLKDDIKDLANVEAWVKVYSFDALSKYPDDLWHPVTASFSDPFSIVAANGKAAIVGAVVAFGLKIGSSGAVSDIVEGAILDVTPAGYSLMPHEPDLLPLIIKADQILGARVKRGR